MEKDKQFAKKYGEWAQKMNEKTSHSQKGGAKKQNLPSSRTGYEI